LFLKWMLIEKRAKRIVSGGRHFRGGPAALSADERRAALPGAVSRVAKLAEGGLFSSPLFPKACKTTMLGRQGGATSGTFFWGGAGHRCFGLGGASCIRASEGGDALLVRGLIVAVPLTVLFEMFASTESVGVSH